LCLDSDVCQLIWRWVFEGIGAEMSDDPPAQPPSAYRKLCVGLWSQEDRWGGCVLFPSSIVLKWRLCVSAACPRPPPCPHRLFFCQISDSSAATAADRKQTQAATVARLVVGFIAVVCPSPPLLIVCCCCVSEQTPRRLFLCQIDSTFVWLS
jgi:hypothetical protein